MLKCFKGEVLKKLIANHFAFTVTSFQLDLQYVYQETLPTKESKMCGSLQKSLISSLWKNDLCRLYTRKKFLIGKDCHTRIAWDKFSEFLYFWKGNDTRRLINENSLKMQITYFLIVRWSPAVIKKHCRQHNIYARL